MKLFYLVSAIIITVLVLVISFAQFGAVCAWYLFSSTAPVWGVLLQMAFLGSIVGGLLVLFWKTESKADDEEGGENE